MLASARTFTLVGVEAREVQVEVDVVGRGLPAFSLVGLPDAAVRESRERVRSALANSGFEFPQSRITANLAPADLRKAGPSFDLAIAAALLAASKQLPPERLHRVALAGELALDGSIRPVPGTLAMAEAAGRSGSEAIAVPVANGPEAALAGGPRVVPLERLEQLSALGTDAEPPTPAAFELSVNGSRPGAGDDFALVEGQMGVLAGHGGRPREAVLERQPGFWRLRCQPHPYRHTGGQSGWRDNYHGDRQRWELYRQPSAHSAPRTTRSPPRASLAAGPRRAPAR